MFIRRLFHAMTVPGTQVRVLFGLPRAPGACRCLLDLPHDPGAHPRLRR
ncbi:MAG: hypothetical protein HOV86_10015 [Thermoactinospora sp.]|nr:hypothetical protein [Thermoactinospora sp.]